MGVSVGVSVGAGVSVGREVGISVSVGMGVKDSVAGILIDGAAGSDEFEAGVPPVLLVVQANVINIMLNMRRYFDIFMA